jgi:hypothetical protein
METTTSTLSKEQRELRIGKFTGSEIYKIMGARGLGKTGETYIFEKAAEFLTGLPVKEEFTSAATAWGCEHETEAKQYFEAATGKKVTSCTTLSNEYITGTPDGIIPGLDCGFEIKCPFNSGNHLKNLSMSKAADLLDLRPEYYWQCVAYMWLTGLNNWKFCSYDPRFWEEKRMLILNLELVLGHLQALKDRVIEAQKVFNEIILNL